jgi:two-component system chemotaxis response regulator CheB
VAPPDHHLLLEHERICLSRGPKEHHSRPAIDPLFRSAALCYGPRVVGVILSGHLDDGTAGLQAVKGCGGLAVVQDPRDAEVASMPMSALRHVDVDHCEPVADMGRLLAMLAREPVPTGDVSAPSALRSEHAVGMSNSARDAMRHLQAFAAPSTHSCPDCGGVLWEVKGAEPARFRCHTGHAFTLLTLAESMREVTEDALQNAIRALQEQAILLRRAAVAKRETVESADARRSTPMRSGWRSTCAC